MNLIYRGDHVLLIGGYLSLGVLTGAFRLGYE
jgi:hypothetical protein